MIRDNITHVFLTHISYLVRPAIRNCIPRVPKLLPNLIPRSIGFEKQKKNNNKKKKNQARAQFNEPHRTGYREAMADLDKFAFINILLAPGK